MGNRTSALTPPRVFPPLDSLPKESFLTYYNRNRIYSEISQQDLSPNSSGRAYLLDGIRTYGINEDSIPSSAWTRTQCMFWIKYFLEAKLALPKRTSTLMACGFTASGDFLVRMEKQDWEDMYRGFEQRYAWLSLWARLEEIKEKGLVGEEVSWKLLIDSINSKARSEEKQQGNDAVADDTWTDDLLTFSEKSGN